MNHLYRILFLTLLLLAPAGSGWAQGHGDHPAGIMADQAWARASAGNATNGAAYMALTNHTAQDDRLVAARAKVSKSVELHTHIDDNGVMRMRQVPDIALPQGKTVTLEPGGLHVMFMGLNAPLKEGDAFDLTLVFDKAGEVTTKVTVKGASAGGEHTGEHGNHSMH
ncbi:MAG: copper chaperone PCu(A)C [Magnetococcales bacterium]|nr:copper chaperone PCu(A)C [Magnetococcales bacterium]